MAHADIAVQAIETLLVEYLVYKAHVLVVIHLAFGALGVADGDAAAFLAPVLQGIEAVVTGRDHIHPVRAVDPEYSALLMKHVKISCIHNIIVIHQLLHTLICLKSFRKWCAC